MMKIALTLTLLAAVVVTAFPGRGRKCGTGDYECQCMKMMKPVVQPDRNAMKATVEACAAENGFDLPKRPGPGRGRGKRSPRFFKIFPDEMKNCIGTSIMTDLGLMDESGSINVDSANTYFTDVINANKGVDVTDTQVDAIIAAVPDCATEANGQNLKAQTFHACVIESCVTSLDV